MHRSRRYNAPPPFIVGTPKEKTFGSVSAYSADLTMAYNPGDLLIVFVATDGDGRAPGSVTGWTRITPINPGANGECWAIWKVATGTEGTSVTWSEVSTTAGATLAVAVRRQYRFNQNPLQSSSSGGSLVPPSLTATWLRPQDVALWIGFTGMKAATSITIAGWQNPNWTWTTADKRIAMEWAWLRGPAVQPPAFTQSGSASVDGSHTWAIRGNA